jgi:Family of unknown function (DUF5895)
MTRTYKNGKGTVASVALLEKPVQKVDEFDSPVFEGSDESLPYLQMLNHQDPGKAGFFITTENAEAVKFRPGAAWETHTTTFQSGETATGYRSLSLRMVVLRRSALMMFDRDSGDYIDLYRKTAYDRATMVLKTRYLVYLVDESNQLLHEQPLLFTTKGAMCGDFGDVYQRFRREMSRAFGQARGTHKPRGDKFLALSVLQMTVRPELKGREKKSWVCSIAAVNRPTPETWMAVFVGYDEATKLKVYGAFEDWVDFGKPERELEAQQRRQVSASADDVPSEFAYEYSVDSEGEIEF